MYFYHIILKFCPYLNLVSFGIFDPKKKMLNLLGKSLKQEKEKKEARSTVNDTVGVGVGRILEVNGFYLLHVAGKRPACCF